MTTYTISLKDGQTPEACKDNTAKVNFSAALPSTLAASAAVTLSWSGADTTFQGMEIIEGPVKQTSGGSLVNLLTFNPNTQSDFPSTVCPGVYGKTKSLTYKASGNSLTMTVSSTIVRSYMYVFRLWFKTGSNWWYLPWNPTVVKLTTSTYSANTAKQVPSANSDGKNDVSVDNSPPDSKYGDRLRFAWSNSTFKDQGSNNTSLQGIEFLNSTDQMFSISSGSSVLSQGSFPTGGQPGANYCSTNPTYAATSAITLAVKNPKRDTVTVKLKVWFKSGSSWWFYPEQFDIAPRVISFTFKANGAAAPTHNSAATSSQLTIEATTGYSLTDVELGPSDSVRWAWDQKASGSSPWSKDKTVIFQGMQVLACDRIDEKGNATAALQELNDYAGLNIGTEIGMISNRADGQYTPMFQAVTGQLEMVDKQLFQSGSYLGIRYLLWFTTTSNGSTNWWYVDPEVDFEPSNTVIPPDDDDIIRPSRSGHPPNSRAGHPLKLR